MSAQEDWQSWRAGRDAGGFERLVSPHLPHVLAAACRSGCSATEAEDVLQEALIQLARESSDAPVRVGVRAWLIRRARFQAKKIARSAARRRRHEAASSRPRPAGVSLDARDEVQQALTLLDETDRQAVILRFLHDLDYREIAYVLGVSENACRIRVHRGIGRLRRRLGGGAAALVAALGLPAAPAAARVDVATAAMSATATGGAIAMTTGTKMGLAALLGAAVAASGLLATDAVFRGEPAVARSPREVTVPQDAAQDAADRAFMQEALRGEQHRREEARIRADDSGLDVLRRYLEYGADITALLADFDRFAGHVRPADGPVLRIEATGEITDVAFVADQMDADVIEFGPGTFRLKWRQPDPDAERPDFYREVHALEIRGAGVEATRLILETNSLLQFSGTLEHLRIHDLHLVSGGRGTNLLDLRGATAAIVERVRVDGIRSFGLFVDGPTYLGCRDCDFGGGPHGGSVLDLRDEAVVLMERCRFDGAERAVTSRHAARRGCVLLRDCTFRDTPLGDANLLHLGEPYLTIDVQGGTVVSNRGGDLDTWGARYATSLRGLEYQGGPLACTIEDLEKVAASVRLEDGEILTGVVAVPSKRGRFVVFVQGEGRRARESFLVDMSAGAPVAVEADAREIRDLVRVRAARLQDPDPVAFRRALEAARAYYGKLVFGAVLRPLGDKLALQLSGDGERSLALLDAVTGEPLR